jgi:hypothetical protein
LPKRTTIFADFFLEAYRNALLILAREPHSLFN